MIIPADVKAARAVIKAWAKDNKRARPKIEVARDGRQREPRVRDGGFLAFLRRQPCVVGPEGCGGRIDPAHIRMHKPGERPTGAGRKPDDSRCLSLCRTHHEEQGLGEVRFWATRGLDPFQIAADLYRKYGE